MLVASKFLAIGRNIAFEKLSCRLPTSGAVTDFDLHDQGQEIVGQVQRLYNILAKPELAARIRHIHLALIPGTFA